jgi:hypothetical protein
MTFPSRIFLALSFGWVGLLMPSATLAQVGGSGNTCVFVFGTINGQTVTTPSVMIVVPATDVVLGPTRVHVDPVSETFLGFTLTIPGADQTVNGANLFVPGVDQTVPSYAATINDLNVNYKSCVNFGVTTPAVEIDVPASALAIPGALVDTPEITINALGVQKTVSGQTLTINCQTIVFPSINEVAPSVTAGTPDQTIAVDLNGVSLPALNLNISQAGDFPVVVPPSSGGPNELSPGCQAQ